MGLTRAERETILRWDEEERMVSLYSANPAVWRKAARLGLRPVKEMTLKGEPSGKFYTLPLAELGWRRRTPRPRTEAQERAQASAAARFRRRPAPHPDSALTASDRTSRDLR